MSTRSSTARVVPARSLRRALIALACGLAATVVVACATASVAGAAGVVGPHLYGLRAATYVRLHPRAGEGAQLRTLARTVHLPAATGPLVWSDPAPIDVSPLDSASCPSITLCVAVDRDGGVLWSADPIGPPSSWHGADVDGSNELTGIACPSTTLCVAVDSRGDIVTSTAPTGGAAAWSITRVDTNSTATDTDNGGPVLMRGISCPSTTLCVAVDAVGDAFVSADPAAGASATWTAAYADPARTRGCSTAGLACQPPIVAVSCPSVSTCAAVDVAGNILTTATPATGPWTVTPTAVGSFWGISCPTASFCAAATGPSRTMLSFNPATPSALAGSALPNGAYNVFCPAQGLCLAPAETDAGVTGLLGTVAPAARRPRWTFGPPGGTDAVSCPSAPDACLAFDDEGDVTPGESQALVFSDLGSGLLSPRRHPSRQAIVRAGGERLRMPSAITAGLTLQWLSVHSGKAPPTVLASGSYRFRRPGLGTLQLTLTPAGILALAGRSRLTVEAMATFTTSTGLVTRSRRLVFPAPPKPRRHHRRRPRRR